MNMGLNVGTRGPLDVMRQLKTQATSDAQQLGGDGKPISTELSDASSISAFNGAEIAKALAEQIEVLSRDVSPQVDQELNTIDRVMEKLTEMAGHMTGGDLTPDQARILQAQTEGLLYTISNIFSEDLVDRQAILNGSNVELDGSSNTSYVLKTEREDVIDLGKGDKFDKAVIPENFRNIIACLGKAYTEAAAIAVGESAPLSQDALTLWKKANDDTTDMLVVAKGNQETVGRVAKDATDRLAKASDDIKSQTEPDVSDIAQKLSDKKNMIAMIQAIIAMYASLAKEANETAKAIAGR